MRIVEPRKYKSNSNKNGNKFNIKFIIGNLLLIFVISALLLYAKNPDKQSEVTAEVSNITEFEEFTTQTDELPEKIVFSGNELRLLYDNILLPNTKKVNTPPVITGNDIADARIRVIAEKRGYKLRNVATEVPTYFEGYRLQDSVREPWKKMQKSISSTGLNMSIVSAYRSVDDQRELFISRLQAKGVSVADVAAGTADEKVDELLITTSIPGYSKHHSGYTVDLFCAGWIFEDFYKSDCNEWLVGNNYENAKKYGFIPSYPLDADLQGPDPEAWEYVYIGTESLQQ